MPDFGICRVLVGNVPVVCLGLPIQPTQIKDNAHRLAKLCHRLAIVQANILNIKSQWGISHIDGIYVNARSVADNVLRET